MFDIGFFELMVIAIVGLLVIGPERLPETLRTLALAAGRIKRGLRDTRQELEKQIGADEIRRQLHNEEILAKVEQTRRELNKGIDMPPGLGHNLLDDEPEPVNKMLPDEPDYSYTASSSTDTATEHNTEANNETTEHNELNEPATPTPPKDPS